MDTNLHETPAQKYFTLSRRFILAVGIIYSLLIIATSLTVNLAIRKNSEILKSTIDEYSSRTLIDRAKTAGDALTLRNASSIKEIENTIKDYCTEEKGFLHAIIYSKTDDENYFKVMDIIGLSEAITVDLRKDDVVREIKDTNYLKNGLIRETADPEIYSSGSRRWKNVYVPYTAGEKRRVVQFMLSAPASFEAMEVFNESTRTVRFASTVVSIALVVAVVALTALFLHNYSLLISNLSSYMREAAGGNLDLALNPAADAELQQLAVSFNSLIEEMRDIKDTQEKATADAISAGDLFKNAVAMMKDQKYEEAVPLFMTLLHAGRYNFGSYFNLGVAQAKLRNYAASLELFQKAIEINAAHELTQQYIDKVKRLQNFNG